MNIKRAIEFIFTILLVCFLSLHAGTKSERLITETTEVIYSDSRSGWEFVNITTFYPDCDFCDHRFEARRSKGEEKGTENEPLVRNNEKSLQFLQALHCPRYTMVFFRMPYLTPSGCAIIGCKIANGKKPVIIFSSPRSIHLGIYSELQDVKVEDNYVTGKLIVASVEDHDRSKSLEFEFCISEDDEPITDNVNIMY